MSIFCVFFLENEWIQLSDIGTIDYQLLIRGRAPSHGSIQFDTALTVTEMGTQYLIVSTVWIDLIVEVSTKFREFPTIYYSNIQRSQKGPFRDMHLLPMVILVIKDL